MAAPPQHKTDAIYCVENLDRHDNRDAIITNLFDTCERLMSFAKKHLLSVTKTGAWSDIRLWAWGVTISPF